uniref:Potassium channel domain-containing protein n=1 Tax=Periophthalmus magnuspinnatus TaxID=409849 RepID=A0A3B3ZSX2_9GOBI
MGFKEMFNLARVPSILLLGALYVAYVLIGGVIFWHLEGQLGTRDVGYIIEQKQNLLNKYTCLNAVQDASKAGISLRSNYTTDGFWKFTTSAVFAATVVTTIGYGNISPRSSGGQIFCVFFALFGIPLNIVVLNRVGKYMLAIERNISDFLEGKMNHNTRWIHFISYLSGMVLFFVVPMLVFQNQEGWTYSQAIYYCFITLSTIGFGDFVADNNPEKTYPDWYSILTACWIFFGLAWLALVINHSIEILERINNQLKGWWGSKNPKEGSANAEDNHNTEPETDTSCYEANY